MKGIVRESISFKRGLSDEEIKHNILGYHVGEIIRKNHWGEDYVYMITEITDDDVEVLYLGHFRIKSSYTKDIGPYPAPLLLWEIKPVSKVALQNMKEKISEWDIKYIRKLTGITLDI